MRGKKQHHEEHVDETWLLPYSDMMTLLLALFIVMFAMSKVDNQKAKQLSQQFNIVFSGGNGALKSSNSAGETFKIDDMPTLNEKNGVIEQDKMVRVKSILEESIKSDGYADKIKVDLNGEGLDIRIQDTVIFNTGQADILNEFAPVLMKISNMIKDLDNEIKVSGHTDNVPIKNEKFRSNWDLSYMRVLELYQNVV